MAIPPLSPDFRDFLSLLNSEQIEYLVIGGYAVAHYGYVRYTMAIDLWVAVSPVNLDRLRAALHRFGFAAQSLPDPLFQPPRSVLRMGMPPNRIEVLSEISGVSFGECFDRRVNIEVDGIRIPVLALHDLVANKKASGRPKDLGDVGELMKARSGQPQK